MPFLEMSCIYIKRKDIHKILVIFRLFTNLPQTIYLRILSQTFRRRRGKEEAGEETGCLFLHRHLLDISRAITAESSSLCIASGRIRTGTFDFRLEAANH